jgi:hypothetical protein
MYGLFRLEERKNELVLTFKPPKNPIPFPVPLEKEYEPSALFPHHLKEPIENVGEKLNIFHTTQPSPYENECFFLDILQAFVEDSLSGILTKDCFSLPFIYQPIKC